MEIRRYCAAYVLPRMGANLISLFNALLAHRGSSEKKTLSSSSIKFVLLWRGMAVCAVSTQTCLTPGRQFRPPVII
jgi:hypothetical protein